MDGRDVVESAVEGYLDAVATSLVGPRVTRAAILDELRDGLHDAIATRVRHGDRPGVAVRAAVAECGAPAAVARGFAGELAGDRARRTVAAYLGTGPLVGLLWMLAVAPPGWWRSGPAGLWAAIPPAPGIALACGVGVLVVTATGRASRWLPIPPEQIVHAALFVVAVAAVSDLVMLALATRPDGAAGTSTIGILAITASSIRLASSIPTAARCLRVRSAVAR